MGGGILAIFSAVSIPIHRDREDFWMSQTRQAADFAHFIVVVRGSGTAAKISRGFDEPTTQVILAAAPMKRQEQINDFCVYVPNGARVWLASAAARVNR